LLIDSISWICDGRLAGVISAAGGADEVEKRLGSALLGGDSIIALDNIDAPLGGPLLCSMLTQQTVKIRILGLSEQPDLPANILILANGNNLVLEGDVVRRTLVARLDAKVESPELREFDTSPIEMIRADRGKYVCAALTILRAYHVAGRSDQPKPALGSFEEWSGWVRGALMWLGVDDPCKVMAESKRADPKLATLVGVIEQWKSCIGSVTVTTKGIIDEACAQKPAEPSGGEWTRAFYNPEFREALLGVAGEGGKVNSVRLGLWLRHNRDRLVNGQRIVLCEGKAQGDWCSGGSKMQARGSSTTWPPTLQWGYRGLVGVYIPSLVHSKILLFCIHHHSASANGAR
jgi:putative DNA primase/helicase